jgi:hypothetical protein
VRQAETGDQASHSTLLQHVTRHRPDWQDTLGLTHIGGTFHFGGLDQSATLRSIELFAREVAPVFSPVRSLAPLGRR